MQPPRSELSECYGVILAIKGYQYVYVQLQGGRGCMCIYTGLARQPFQPLNSGEEYVADVIPLKRGLPLTENCYEWHDFT